MKALPNSDGFLQNYTQVEPSLSNHMVLILVSETYLTDPPDLGGRVRFAAPPPLC